MSKIEKLSQANSFKKFFKNLDESEIEQVYAIIDRHIAKEVNDRTMGHRKEQAELHKYRQLAARFEGYYWATQGEIACNNLMPEHIDGINEGLQYLMKKPDQIIQHYGDPNPKAKVIQHRKDQQYSGI